MAISLKKGETISLDKAAQGELGDVIVAAGWDERSTGGRKIDLDLVVAALGPDGRVPDQKWFIYYGNKKSPGKVIRHSGDNLTGAGDGDDESIFTDFPNLPPTIERLVVAVNSYSRQTFGEVTNAFARAYDSRTGQEYARYNLGQEASTETLMVFAEIYRYNGEWKFRAIGEGMSRAGFCDKYGVTSGF